MASLAVLLGQIGPRAGNHMNWDDGRPVGRVIFMVICAIVLIGLVVGVIIALRRTSTSTTQAVAARAPSITARDLLDQRLARGEIEPADYEERKRLLS